METRSSFKQIKDELDEKLRKAPYGNKLAVYNVSSGELIEMWLKDPNKPLKKEGGENEI
jgi:hypothetical protein